MSYLSENTHQDIITNPSQVQYYYQQCWRQFTTDLGAADPGMSLPGGLLSVAWAAVIAFDLKPYGPEPAEVDLQTLLHSPTLACDHYVRLAWYFCDNFLPQTSGIKITAVGWNGGAVGNHAQFMAYDPVSKISLLLDPTTGLVANGVTYDSLLKGVGSSAIGSFAGYNSYPGAFSQTVKNAVSQGQYKPSDALYYVNSLELFNAMPSWSNWMTPQGAILSHP